MRLCAPRAAQAAAMENTAQATADQRPAARRWASGAGVGVPAQEGLVEVAGEDGGEGGDAEGERAHEGGEQSGEAESEQSVGQDVGEQVGGDHFVVEDGLAGGVEKDLAGGWIGGGRDEAVALLGLGADDGGFVEDCAVFNAGEGGGVGRGQGDGDEAGQDQQHGEHEAWDGGQERGLAGCGAGFGGQGNLEEAEVSACVACAEDEAESQGGESQMEAGGGAGGEGVEGGGGEGGDEAGPTADGFEAEEDDREQAGDEDEELQRQVADDSAEAAEEDVAEHDEGGDGGGEEEDALEGPVHGAEEPVEDVEGLKDAGDESEGGGRGDEGGEGKDGGEEGAGFGVEAEAEELGERAGF